MEASIYLRAGSASLIVHQVGKEFNYIIDSNFDDYLKLAQMREIVPETIVLGAKVESSKKWDEPVKLMLNIYKAKCIGGHLLILRELLFPYFPNVPIFPSDKR